MPARPTPLRIIQCLGAALLLSLAGCAFEKNKALSDASAINPETAGFAEVKSTSLQKCMSCHSSWAGEYAGVVPNLTEISRLIQLNGPGQMPPASRAQLTEAEKQLLLRWIERGAPEIGSAPAPVILPKPVLVGFPSPQKEILAEKCVRCHRKSMASLETFRPYYADAASRITSPFDFDIMPPPNKGELTEEEMNVLVPWLKAQAAANPIAPRPGSGASAGSDSGSDQRATSTLDAALNSATL